MKSILLAGAALLVLAPGTAFAASAFDGTWKADMNSVKWPSKPGVYLLKDGMYSCKTCVPAYTIKADGTDQAVAGSKYFDTEAVKVVDDHTTQFTDKKAGKVVSTSTITVAKDGNTLDMTFTDSSASNAAPVTGKGSSVRVGKPVPGAHITSGMWRTQGMSSMSDNAITVSYKTDGDLLTMTSPTGQKYTAKMDGSDAPISGDPGLTMVSVKKINASTLEESDKRDGKLIAVLHMMVAKDGKSMTVNYMDKQRGTTTTYKEMKQ